MILPMEAPRLLDAYEREGLRILWGWRRRRNRPIALTGLVGLGRHELGPGLVVAATFAPGTGRLTLTCDRRQIGQLVLGRDGVFHLRRALERWAERHDAPAGAMTALRRRLELVLTRQLEGGLWAAARAEVEARRAAEPVQATAAEERAS